MKRTQPKSPVFGVVAEFAGAEELVHAIHRAREAGFENMEAYTPLPVHEVIEALGHRNRLPVVVLVGGIFGACAGFLLQYWTSVVDYPINVGGRPLNSWPSFVIVTFEMAILCAALSAVLGMLALNGLPRPHHPIFHAPNFELASRNRFFLMILHYDPRFDRAKARAALEAALPIAVTEVPH